jgi:hypothetical protein
MRDKRVKRRGVLRFLQEENAPPGSHYEVLAKE